MGIMKPKGARGLAAVKRLGRTYKTGNFAKGVNDLESKGYGADSSKKIMGAQYWNKARRWKKKSGGGLVYGS